MKPKNCMPLPIKTCSKASQVASSGSQIAPVKHQPTMKSLVAPAKFVRDHQQKETSGMVIKYLENPPNINQTSHNAGIKRFTLQNRF